MTSHDDKNESLPVEERSGLELIEIDLTGRDPSIWEDFRLSFGTRLKNLYEAVVSLETFKRRSVGAELDRIVHAIIESLHAKLEAPAIGNEKTRADIAAAVQKKELDREKTRIAKAEADRMELENRQRKHVLANRELQRRVAKGEVQLVEHKGRLIVIATNAIEESDDH